MCYRNYTAPRWACQQWWELPSCTPLFASARADPLGEGNTQLDGIVGQFAITGSKGGATLDPGCRCLAVFEAKMPAGGLVRGVTNVPGCDQVSRRAACMMASPYPAGLTMYCETCSTSPWYKAGGWGARPSRSATS